MSPARLFHALLLLVVLMTSGCSSLAFYAQSIQGHMQLMNRSKPIAELLGDESLPPDLARKLESVLALRDFASRELALPDNDSYRHYADLEREYVVWNVFAAPALSLEGKQWCYLFAGCLDYRGYFSRERSIAYAAELQQQGLDTWVGGVTAYSTLGWFDDPVLNTMLERGMDYLAKTLFHELAHQKLYIKNDTAVNEAFAETVALEGLRRWHEQAGKKGNFAGFLQRQQHEEQFIDLVLHYRQKLEALYRSGNSDRKKREQKKELIEQMVSDYRQMRADWPDDDRYDSWFATDINNAKLLAVSTYRQYVPALRNKLAELGHDLPAFYTFMERLGQCSRDERRAWLESVNGEVTC